MEERRVFEVIWTDGSSDFCSDLSDFHIKNLLKVAIVKDVKEVESNQ